MYFKALSIALLGICLVLLSCTSENENNRTSVVIGFSQCTTGDDWRRTMNEEMLREISLYRDYDIELIIKDAKDNNEKQISDINALVKDNIDILIVSPNEAEPLTDVVESVYESGIPVIVVDRKINSEKFTAYIGADNLEIGREAGRFASGLIREGNILEITGLSGSTPAIERGAGFREVVNDFPEIKIALSFNGAWQREIARKLVDSVLKSNPDIDLIFAHNDPMAYGSFLSARKNSLKPFILGIDGLNNGGVQMVLDGNIDGTFLYPTGGNRAIQLALKILSGAAFEKYNTLSTVKIDYTNARTLKLQGDRLKEQQAHLDSQLAHIGEMDFLLKRQKTFLWLTSLTGLLLALLAAMTVYFLGKKNKINKVLDTKNKTIAQQNHKITRQRDDVIRLLKIAEEATEMKIRFFTSISHEFRNTLSLIALPLENLINTLKDENLKERLKTIQSNSNRLLRLSDEILNFRKIDKHKYQLNMVQAEIATFIQDVVNSFLPLAREKNIDLLFAQYTKATLLFDMGIIEKVVCNLISNAIKYTEAGGKIMVSLEETSNNIQICVRDNGCGIPKQQIPYIFDPFYRVTSHSYDVQEEGFGMGLALCKELAQLHGGTLNVKSKPTEGSAFTFSIPKSYQKSIKKKTELDHVKNTLQESLIPHNHHYTVLIVEDNKELLTVLADMVGKYYQVLIACDGKTGLESAVKNIPDLIISDIYMPIMDGIELCREIKKDPKTVQIPIILLTALESQESMINGFDIGADDYLSKPVNESILISRIRNLINSRERLKQAFQNSTKFIANLSELDSIEQEFVNQCIHAIQDNITNESFHIDDLADSMHTSRSTLYRKIKEITGLKAVEFVKKVKLQHGAKLLLADDYTISELAWLSGFSDAKYFSKCFAKEFGHKPSHFRSAILSDKRGKKELIDK